MKALAALVLVLLAVAGGASAARDPWKPLHRPLHVPALAPGAPCPTAQATGTVPTLGTMPAWGRGPAWPVAPRSRDRLAIAFERHPDDFGEWAVEKILWIVAPGYRGPILVRGAQLDGPNRVRFESGEPGFTPYGRLHPVLELRLRGAYGHPATTRVLESGCYAWQLDGVGFSRTIVFEAVVV